tara:strand:- start:5461 stop:6825 length:1365 start_codon:yes stop_codon:yes gene_type:complete
MKIIVLGAGKVGSNIAKNLSVQSYDICVVDKAVSKLKKLQSEYDLAIVSGHASHPDVLKKAGIDSDTILISVTNDDEVNIVACQIAKQIFDVKKTICRLSDSSYIKNLSAFGKEMIDIPISPELEVTDHIIELIDHPGAELIETFADGKVKLVSVKAKRGGKLVNRELKSIKNDIPDIDTFVPTIYRKNKAIVPDGNTVIKENDQVYFLSAEKNIDSILKEMRDQNVDSSRIMIVGGGMIGSSLASSLENKYKVKVLETSLERCEMLSKDLNKAIVLNGDGSDEELLRSENIENIDVFCALTDDDETNIMSAFLAKKLGAKKTLIILNNYAYINILPKSFVDLALSPQRMTVSLVMQHLSSADLPQEVLLNMTSGAEALEGVIHNNHKTKDLFGKTYRDLPLPENAVLGAIVRNGSIFTPSKNINVEMNDHIIVFINGKTDKDQIEALFSNQIN